ncbi:MAG: histidine phosphatase family protein [Pseudomonas marincola]|uniref:lipopolysaccharide core heptose(II)-phosphate phosphatase PmrG n=1 Tax=Pseudomonas TaxID=286 RepID=UPI00258055AD|nr:histidine phosphatase family protein [Pseudomonas sp.]
MLKVDAYATPAKLKLPRQLRVGAIVALFIAAFFAVYAMLKVPQVPELASAGAQTTADMLAQWKQGHVIVLVRHVERCDHSSAPCLDRADGITARAKEVAQSIGQSFVRLGVTNSDIYTSPRTRTEQTAGFMFNKAVASQSWLAECRNGMLENALKHKVRQRNLVLVTHSECFDQMEKELGVHSPLTPAYGSALMIASGEVDGAAHILGSVNEQQWSKVLAN